MFKNVNLLSIIYKLLSIHSNRSPDFVKTVDNLSGHRGEGVFQQNPEHLSEVLPLGGDLVPRVIHALQF